MIDLSEFPVGQRFRTRGGRKVRLLSVTQGIFQVFPRFTLGIEVAEGLPLQPQEYSKSGKALSAIDWDEITSPIYGVPARTRRLPKPLPMPTGYQRQWPHLYQYGGQV